jgi:hypothetical protein
MSALPSLALLLAGVLATGPRQELYFQAGRHLEGFQECQASEFADLFPLDEFDRKSGSKVTPAELETLQQRWSEARRTAEERIARIRADPSERALYGLEKKLKEHAYLGRVDYKRVDDHAPFFFYVQRPDQDDPAHARTVAEGFARWFAELLGVFTDEFVTPLQLERRDDYPAFALFVLRSNGAYDDYADALAAESLYITRAHYDQELRLAVTFRDVYGRLGEQKRDERRAALHEMVHGLQHAYRTAGEAAREPTWLDEGLADYLSFHDGVVPGVLRAHQLDLERLAFLAEIGSAEVLDACLPPLEELAALQGYAHAVEHLNRRAQARGHLLPPEASLGAFYTQSSLWVHYLRHGEGGKHREAFGRLVRASLTGNGGLAGLHAAFEGLDLAALDAGFRRYLNQHLGADLRSPTRVNAAASVTEPGASGVLPARAAAARPLPLFEPADLAPSGNGPEEAFELALGRAARGELAAAARGLAELAGGIADPALRERVEREVHRLEELVRERRRFLEHVAARGDKLDLRLDDGRLLAVVREVGDEEARLGANKLGLERLTLEAIDPGQLARLVRDRKYGFAPGWIAAYACVLAGEEDWRKLAKGSEPEVAALRADAEGDYGPRLRRARALETIARYAAAPLPEGTSAAEAAFAELAEFARSSGDLEPVEQRADALARYGSALLHSAFSASGPALALRGRTEALADGRVRLTYAFERPEELQDFQQRRYLSALCSGRSAADFEVADGCLSGAGCLSAHHVLEFEGPSSVHCSYRVREPSHSYDPSTLLQLGLADDGLGSFVTCSHNGGVFVLDMARQQQEQRVSPVTLSIGQRYELEVRSDGEGKVESFLDQRSVAQVNAGARRQGGVFLFATTELTIEIDALVIEGRISAPALARLEAGWIERRLTEAGLGHR